ncbi:hypothetical protein ACG74X_19725 [Marivita sp. S0852]|uniref:hypothetical protein n=1 Tax=Marivita sp. S0852 TaxID=3373893 RepID=UPI0039829F56
MLIHTATPGTLRQSLRGRLLSQALRRHLHLRGDTLAPSVPRATGAQAVQDTLTLASLPPRPYAPQTLSLGLGLPQALRHGPATLLLTQSLYAELETFGGATAWTAAGTLPLVLQGYSRAILTERADIAASVGFAPWIPLALADRFPVEAAKPPLVPGAVPRILILDHGAPTGQTDVLRRALQGLHASVRIVTPDSDHASMGAGLVADLHLHLGFAPNRAITALSPFDSLLSGAYTLVLAADGQGAGQALRALCSGRSYVDLAPTLSELASRARTMLDRLQAIRHSGDRQNPEIARFTAANAAVRAADYKRFDAVLDTPPQMSEAA